MDDHTSSVSVLIRAGDLGDRLPKIVTALDEQTLPYSRYETIFMDPGSSDATSKRLRDLEQRRPNVRVLDGGNPTWRSAVEAAIGDYVLCLGPRDVLIPAGLETLLETAAGGHDVVLAGGGDRVPLGFLPDAFAPGELIDPAAPASGVAVLAPFALVRRETLSGILDDEPSLLLRQTRVALLRSASSIATCATPVGVGPGPDDAQSAADVWSDVSGAAELLGDGDVAAWFVATHAAAALENADDGSAAGLDDQIVGLVQRHWKDRNPEALPLLHRRVVQALVERDLSSATSAARAVSRLEVATTSASAEWSTGVLNLMVNGTIQRPDGSGDADLDRCRVQLSIRNVANSLQYDLASEVTLDRSATGMARFTANSGIDIGRALYGEPLTPGIWQVDLRLVGLGAARLISSPVPFCPVAGAVVDATPVSVFAAEGRLRLDVGAGRHGLLGGPYQPSQATVSHTVNGSLLSISASDVAVRGDAMIPSSLFLGSFRLPAVLRSSDEGARLECYVSGLAGVSKLEAKISDSVREPLGLQLRISAVGDMAVETATRAAPNPKPQARTASKPATPEPPREPSNQVAGGGSFKGVGTKQSRAAGSRGKSRSGLIVNRLPEPLRPLARRAARSPLVRRVHRQIVRRD